MNAIRHGLGWKLFISYLIVILVGVVSLALTAEWHAPQALERHMAIMPMVMDEEMVGMMDDLSNDFRQAVNEVVLVAAAIAMAAAVAVSTIITRRIVSPIQEMTNASQRIAAGDYNERVAAVSEDELGELARSFNQMAVTLSETEQRRLRLIGDVAHELRTPLSSIKSAMEGLIDGIFPADPATFLNIQREVGRLQRLVHDLEELSRAEAGQIPLELQTTNPATFVQAAAERLRFQYEDKRVTLQVELPVDLSPVRADVARMTQVLLNLLGNALQYTPTGGQVTVRGRAGDKAVYLAIQDAGIGLAAEELPHIFERFYRVDKSRSRAGGGSGIGLTISKLLVEAHHGRLEATSPGLGQGSTFTITLPAAG